MYVPNLRFYRKCVKFNISNSRKFSENDKRHLIPILFNIENKLLDFTFFFECEFVNCKSAGMPGSTGGSYRSLEAVNRPNDVVYRSTTMAGNTPGMLDTVKKAFSFVSSSPTKGERLLDVSKTPVILSSRYCILFAFMGLIVYFYVIKYVQT